MTDDTFHRLQAAWADLDRRVAVQEELRLADARRSGLASMRRRLWPFAIGQLLQIPLGLLLVALAVAVETADGVSTPVFASAVVLHVYGLATAAWAAITLGLLLRIDPGRPVVEVQERMLRLRRVYLAGSIALGLAWWLLWIPFLATLSTWLGLEGYMAHLVEHVDGHRPLMPWLLGLSAAGFVTSLLLLVAARRNPRLRDRLVRLFAAESLVRADDDLRAVVALREGTD